MTLSLFCIYVCFYKLFSQSFPLKSLFYGCCIFETRIYYASIILSYNFVFEYYLFPELFFLENIFWLKEILILIYNIYRMKIELLEGYKNGLSEDNSVTLRINTGPLNQHLNKAINNENIYNIMSEFTKEYKHITFYHTFRLGHDNREYNQLVTKHHGVLYRTSIKYEANGDNLKDQLQKSLMSIFDVLTDLGNDGWEGVHYINIMMKKNDTIVDLIYDERRKIRTTYKKTAPRKYMFNDDTNNKKQKIKTTNKKTATRGYMFNDDTDDDEKISGTNKTCRTR